MSQTIHLIFLNKQAQNGLHALYTAGLRSRICPEPGYLAGAGAVTLARLRLHLKYLFNKIIHANYIELDLI